MNLKSLGLVTLVASFSFAAGVAVERKAAVKDLESRIYTKEDARLSRGDWGFIRLYTEDGTPTFGTSSTLTAQLEFVPGKQLHPPHQHAEEEFQYIIEGSGTWSLNGKEYPAKQGDLMYSKPWDMHGVLNTSSAPLRFFVFKWNSKGFAPAPPTAVSGPAETDRFEAQVRAYEAADKAEAPRGGGILLAGDSQFFRWKTLAEDLPGYPIVNRGVDSFQLSNLLSYADRLIIPYSPRLVVLHVGGNDVHNGKKPEQVLAEFKLLVSAIRARLDHVQIAFTSLTPSPGRWDEADLRRQTNTLIADYVRTQPDLLFIDLWKAMLTADGKPREDLWVEDRVHPNHAGYLVRVGIMRPILDASLRAKR